MKLWRFEQRWAREVSRSFVGADAVGGTTAGADAGALFADDCATVHWVSALPIRLALWVVWFRPVFSHLHTFSGLDSVAREEVLEKLLHSRVTPVRLMVMFLKLICVSLLLGSPRTLAQLGAYGSRREPPKVAA